MTAQAPPLVALFVLTSDVRNGLISSLIYAIIALSVVVVTGYAGQVSFAQLPLAGGAAFLLPPTSFLRWSRLAPR